MIPKAQVPGAPHKDTTKVTRRRVRKAIRSTLTGVILNAALAAVKGIAGVLGNSYALVADAMESLLDIFHGAVVVGGLKIAASEPDENHPYGHGKAEPIAAVVAAIGLVAAAAGLAIESVRQILEPDPPAPAAYTLFVLIGVIITKELLFRYVFRVSEAVGSVVVRTDAWHHRSDAITSLAAFIGIAVALVGGEGYEIADDWAALVACAVIGYNGISLFIPALNEVMDVAPPADIEATVRREAVAVAGVSGLDACWVRKMGLEYYVDLHVLVKPDISVRAGHDIAHAVKDAVRAADARIRDVLIHIEPDDMPHLPQNRDNEIG